MKRILVTGAAGQVGSELVPALRQVYGTAAVLATDIKPATGILQEGPYQKLDCADPVALAEGLARHRPDTIYHLAALLSANAEKAPQRAYAVNMGTLQNVLEAAREQKLAVFTPSSIGAFGPNTPRDPAPQDTIQRPTTMYGVTKVAGELLCDYYHLRYQLDTRGVRYPGLISYVALPGGGTTDYAVEIFYEAIENGKYTCFLGPDTQLDMMYMPDAVRAAIEIMEAPAERLEHRNAFNVTAMQLTPAGLADLICAELPAFRIDYEIDPVRQRIADSWPRRLDDSAARREWNWKPEYDAPMMVKDMLRQLSSRLKPVAGEG
ncbi:MAG TPA: NAD-dependent epimerase/dehydratase family protein [Longimicrobiales bacterium]|nr:NAD-dependent epimerase/dehydratase family protein [Longimicrobiales bacterium]